MKLFLLFLRGRRAGYAVATILLVAMAAGLALGLSDARTLTTLIVTMAPGAVAAIVGLSTATPFGELEQTASERLAMLRLGHLGALIICGALAFAAVYGGAMAAESWLVAVRNMLGYTGLALIAARLLGPTHSWLAPVLCGVLVIAIRGEGLWAWSLEPAGDTWAALVAGGLLVVGLGLVLDR